MNIDLTNRAPFGAITSLLLAALVLTGLFGAPASRAGIILGDSVDVAIYAPSRSEVCFLCGGTSQVNVEEGEGDLVQPYLDGGDWFDVDIDPTSISIQFNRDIAWQSGDFIGLVISDIDWLEGTVRAIPGASLVASGLSGPLAELTDLFNSRLQHTDSTVELNWQGLSIAAGTRFEISLQAMALELPEAEIPNAVNVPEPGVLLLLAGLIALTVARQRTRRQRAAASD